MFIFRIERDGLEIAHVKSFSVGESSLRVTYSSWANATFHSDISSVTVKRPGFDDLRFTFIPVEVFTDSTHL
jgi:hypothetical protein